VKRPTRTAARRGIPAACLAFLLLAACAGCGKKGPPLAPIVLVPAAPADAAIRRQGDLVTLQLRVPQANADGSTPADIARVEVYGYTGPVPDEEEMIRDGTLVASIPVRRPPVEEGEEGRGPKVERPPGSMKAGFDPGDTIVVSETIGPGQRQVVVPRRRDEDEPVAAAAGPFSPSLGATFEIAPPLRPPLPDPAASRTYMAVGVSRRGRRGEFTAPLRVSLLPPPMPPASPDSRYDETTITVSWQAPADLRRPTLPPQPGEGLLEAKPLGLPSASGGFNAYLVPPEASAPGEAATGPDDAAVDAVVKGPRPAPLNPAPLPDPRFEGPVQALDGTRCYVVTTVVPYGDGPVESAPSDPTCVTLRDTFPPAPPKGLAAVGSTGAVSLIWERSEAADLAGYLVLRAERGAEPTPLTDAPIAETTFRDETVKPGAVYRYVVVALDKAGNRSEPSTAVEESAR
jgi:hypothetical protein